ncbi:uncharacterized protein Dmul_16870 [Desulfococcus multivorans]|nr:uncharacterized protein Dmul_16870 [Desulfococcus multivorans]
MDVVYRVDRHFFPAAGNAVFAKILLLSDSLSRSGRVLHADDKSDDGRGGRNGIPNHFSRAQPAV